MPKLQAQAIKELKGALKGRVVVPQDSDYDTVRAIWNAMIDRRPALIAQCKAADDVAHALAFARANGLEVSIRGAGHNIAGNSICDDGIMIDLSAMKGVRVDLRGPKNPVTTRGMIGMH